MSSKATAFMVELARGRLKIVTMKIKNAQCDFEEVSTRQRAVSEELNELVKEGLLIHQFIKENSTNPIEEAGGVMQPT